MQLLPFVTKFSPPFDRLLLFSALFPLFTQAQVAFPDYVDPYVQNEVTSIYVTLPPDSALAMILNGDDSHFYLAQFIYHSSTISDTIDDAGISLRGNSSLNAFKKSYKISFDEFNNNRTWQRVDQLNLVAQHNDPSLLRSPLAHAMYRYMEVAAPRTSFTRLYVNGEYFGLYLNQEHIDGEFTDKYFDDQGDGNLYKCTYPATLEYISDDPDDYKFANWGTRHYDLKTNEWKDDYADLAHFIDVLNNTDPEDLACELPTVFNVDGFLRAAAVEVLIGHWDSYIFNKNNFYLYHNQLTGQFNFIPYDMDNTFGIDWVGQDWVDRSIYEFSPGGDDRPLYERMMEVDVFRDRFSYYIEFLIDTYFNEDVLIAQAFQWQSLIEEAAIEDLYRPLDYGFDVDDFLNAIDEAFGDPHVDYGLSDYVTFRGTNAMLELDDYTTPGPIVAWITQPVTMSEATDFLHIEAMITGNGSEQCNLEISTDNNNFSVLNGWNDAGINGDAVAGDHIYSIETTQAIAGDKLYYRIALPDGSTSPCDAAMCWLTPLSTGIYINEVMSQNNTVVSYNGLNFPDWLELWNSNNNNANLFTWCLTDDIYNWNKFQFESISIAPDEFKLIWLDNDPEIGSDHATFRLSGNDSTVWLLTIQQGSPRIVNTFYPCEAPGDQSQERIEDGGAIIATTSQPTPGLSNNFVSTTEVAAETFSVYPNPANELLLFSKMCALAKLYDLQGRQIFEAKQTNNLPLDLLESGIYLLNLDGQQVRVVVAH